MTYLRVDPSECLHLDKIDGGVVTVLTEDGVEQVTLSLAPLLPPREEWDEDEARDRHVALLDGYPDEASARAAWQREFREAQAKWRRGVTS